MFRNESLLQRNSAFRLFSHLAIFLSQPPHPTCSPILIAIFSLSLSLSSLILAIIYIFLAEILEQINIICSKFSFRTGMQCIWCVCVGVCMFRVWIDSSIQNIYNMRNENKGIQNICEMEYRRKPISAASQTDEYIIHNTINMHSFMLKQFKTERN